ncbi:MAG: YitT family protein [Peptostreptococcaceae bacterium]|nr:YitT family protein [Peptostreptococcaceae bacterium]
MTFDVKKFLKINFGIILLTSGLYFFLLPSKLVVGGISGLSVILNHYFPLIPVGAIMLACNIILFVLAFIFLGKEFGGYTIYSSLMLSALITLLERTIPMYHPIVDDLLINLLYGIIISGLGMGIIFYQNASTGGTDIIAKIINKFTGVDIGKSLLMSDFLIIVGAAATFGLNLGMYALLGMFINAVVIDNLIAGFNKNLHININSKRYKEINEYIIKEIDRGTTLYHAEGGFSGEDKVIISSVVSKNEYIKIKKFATDLDPEVFMTLNFVSEVHGFGFSK